MKKTSISALVVLLYGCAATPSQEYVYGPAPYNPPYELSASDAEICTNAAAIPESASNRKYWVQAFLARGLDREKCGPHHDENVDLRKRYIASIERQIAESTERRDAIERAQAAKQQGGNDTAGVLFTALAAFAIAKDARRGAFMPPTTAARPVADSDWQWDEFYGPNGQLMWMCRGVQTGMFAEDLRCFGKSKIDFFWPDKRAPF